MTVRFCTRRDGTRLAYTVAGNGPPLVWVPGWISHVELDTTLPLLCTFIEKLGRHHTVIRYDKHGCGRSDRDRIAFTLDAELEDLDTVMRELTTSPVTLVGNSAAGAVAISYAARHPDRVSHLIVHGAWAHGDAVASPQVRESLLAVVRAHSGIGSALLTDLFVPGAGPDRRDEFAAYQRAAADAETTVRLLQLCYDLDVRDELRAVRAPTLVLHRRGDRVARPVNGRAIAAGIPQARFRLLDGRNHFPWEEGAERILAEIAAFLGDPIEAPPPPADAAVGASDSGTDRAVLRRDGDVWLVGRPGHEGHLRDVKGLHYLAALLAQPGVEVHAVDLVAAVDGDARATAGPAPLPTAAHGLTVHRGTGGDLGPVIDARATAAYRRRLHELREEVAEAEALHDPERAAHARAETQKLTDALSGAIGLAGRRRTSGSPAERARVKATRLVKDAVRRVGRVDPPLGHLLAGTVRTGTYCAYVPPPDGGPSWEL
jgi:pimeloyl-ACP methyl ester carboxylesterase